MLYRWLSTFVWFVALASWATAGDGVAPEIDTAPRNLPRIDFNQRLGEPVPLDLRFKDENDQEVTIEDCIGNKPTILVLAYYRCPMLCTHVLNDLLDAMRAIPFTAGKEYNVVTVSFDPKEKPALANEKKKHYLEAYGREGAEAGWKFLTGDKTTINKLTQACGFKYEYDRSLKEFNHASGVMILTPKGVLSKYHLGLKYDPTVLRLSLVEASENKIGSAMDRILLFCWRYDHLENKYSWNIMLVMRLSGALTLLTIGLVYLVILLRWRRRQRLLRNHPVGESADAIAEKATV